MDKTVVRNTQPPKQEYVRYLFNREKQALNHRPPKLKMMLLLLIKTLTGTLRVILNPKIKKCQLGNRVTNNLMDNIIT